ncbi:MAG TPA: hypothetical protein PLM07_15455, partial [Candidatus Rifleibacterium sp.]|nr:hypothetical protein [Candidatus Rifleibacterium sp.]
GNVRPGMPVAATISAEGNDKITLKLPDGSEKTVSTQSAAQGLIHFTSRDTDLTGYYELRNGKRLLGAFAVNSPPEESRLDRINLRRIPRFIALAYDPGRGPTVKEKVSLLRDGYDLGGAAMLLLVLLALFENWLANRPATKNELQA